MSSASQLQFAAFSSALDAGFWHKLSEKKLNVYGLDDRVQNVTGYYCNSDPDFLPPRVNVDYTAFMEPAVIPPNCFPMLGQLKNTNTLEEFKVCDKRALLEAQGALIWDDIISGRAVENPALLARFLMLTHADLKKFHYYYWFAFTALCLPEKIMLGSDAVPITERFSDAQIERLIESYNSACHGQPLSAFIVKEHDGNRLEVGRLAEFPTAVKNVSKVLIGFCDPCTLRTHPGWPLRNLLALVAYHWGNQLRGGIEVVCLRNRTRDGHQSVQHSIILNVHFGEEAQATESITLPKCVGWEKNERQKAGPRKVDLSASMDPCRLAESAVDLNLKLMRWRLLPELDLERISNTRCLLLGAGTLGCNVARCLLGWGVRNVTVVDNGAISYSNPVRQSLFTFEDSMNGGRPKAIVAAEALQRIFPGVNAVGIELSIPMPGHAVSESVLETVQNDVSRLKQLFDEHDAVFLLMDTRESRWLPTLFGAVTGKIVINAALGFDTYLVVRHGVRASSNAPGDTGCSAQDWSHAIPGDRLGCYFCNDVVTPGDSTRDRTLDQQCTVSRPGLSMVAAAVAVELLVSVLVHPLGGHAPADTSSHDDHLLSQASSPLGIVPHQIRGFLSRFHNMMPASAAFDKCTACSSAVLDAYTNGGFEFLLSVFNQPSFLEDLTGLSQLQAETAECEMWDISDLDDSETDVM